MTLAAGREAAGEDTFLTGDDLAALWAGAALGFGAAGFKFFRGDALFFCLVSLAMQSYPVLTPSPGCEGTAPTRHQKTGRFGQDKVTEGVSNGKGERASVADPSRRVRFRGADTSRAC